MHERALEPKQWWGCEHPERPATSDTFYDFDCSRCMLHLRAATTIQGLTHLTWVDPPQGGSAVVSVDRFIERGEKL